MKFPRTLYHVSLKNHDGEIFCPRIPDSKIDEENKTIKRICVSGRISWALDGVEASVYEKYYVHVPVAYPKKLYRPNKNDVPDCN